MNEATPEIELTWPQLAKIIFEAHGIKTGLWQIAVKIRFAGMNMQIADGPSELQDPSLAVPCSMTAMEGFALFPAQAPGPMIFDASQTLAQAPKIIAKVAAAKPRAATKKAAKRGVA